MKRFYVYEWRDVDTGEVFYVGKGCGNRYKSLNHRNKYFLDYYNNHNTESVIVNYFDNEENAFAYELELTNYYKGIGQCQCCLMDGGYGGYSKVWSKEMKEYWSEYNPMKDEKQKEYTYPKTSAKKVIIDGKYIFNSLKEAVKDFFGVKDVSPLCKALKTNKPYHNHIVEYVNQQPS